MAHSRWLKPISAIWALFQRLLLARRRRKLRDRSRGASVTKASTPEPGAGDRAASPPPSLTDQHPADSPDQPGSEEAVAEVAAAEAKPIDGEEELEEPSGPSPSEVDIPAEPELAALDPSPPPPADDEPAARPLEDAGPPDDPGRAEAEIARTAESVTAEEVESVTTDASQIPPAASGPSAPTPASDSRTYDGPDEYPQEEARREDSPDQAPATRPPGEPSTTTATLPESAGIEEGASAGPSPANALRAVAGRSGLKTSRERRQYSPQPRPSAADRPPPELTNGFSLPEPYLRWNRALTEHCLLDPSGGSGPAYLSITPRILSAALEAEEGELLSPEDAALDFAAVVSNAYQTGVLTEPERLWALAGMGPDGTPNSVAFLALSVLAAYQMHTDEEAGPNAYYPRLASLLGCELSRGHPRGFDPRDFGDLWDLLSSWVYRRGGCALALPGPHPGLRRYIAYPLGHVPLRQLDIEKLPDFFEWAGLEPGSKADPEFLGGALRRWSSARGFISRAGQTAISDERRPAVEAQLSSELEAWDGSWIDGLGRRIAAVHVLLDFRRRQPQLFFLPRRPPPFPAIFDDGSHVFEAGEQGWYDRVAMMPDDGPELESGFQWTSSSPRGPVSLHRPPSAAIALRPAPDFTGYLSQRSLPLGIESAVLCTAPLEAATAEFLSAVTSRRCQAMDHPSVPEGWRLFSGIVPSNREPPPPDLETLAVEATATVVLRGGLRIGRRAAWLEGAPPTILVGGQDGLPAALDGHPVTVTDGVLDASDGLDIGQHVVEVGRVRRRLEIVEAEGKWEECAPLIPLGDRPIVSVPLPPGRWSVIGARPDQVARGSSRDRGTLVTVNFHPVWAVSLGTRRGASVLCLTEHPPDPDSVDFGSSRPAASAAAWAWTSAIYDANVRRPRFGWLCEPGADVELRAAWRRYWLASRNLKRRWRRLA